MLKVGHVHVSDSTLSSTEIDVTSEDLGGLILPVGGFLYTVKHGAAFPYMPLERHG